MTAAGEPSRLYPTRRASAPLTPSPLYTGAKEAERHRKAMIRSTRTALTRLVRSLDQVEELDVDGYLEVGVERLITHHGQATDALYELTGELAELVARTRVDELVDEPDNAGGPIARTIRKHFTPSVDEPDEPDTDCTCGHPECGAC